MELGHEPPVHGDMLVFMHGAHAADDEQPTSASASDAACDVEPPYGSSTAPQLVHDADDAQPLITRHAQMFMQPRLSWQVANCEPQLVQAQRAHESV